MDASHLAEHAGREPIGTAHETAQSRQRWQHFIEASPTILYALRRDGDAYLPVWVTDNVTRLLGFSLGEMLDPWWWEAHVHPDDLSQLDGFPSQVAVGSEPIVREYRVRHARGSYLWIRDEARLLADAAGGVLEVVGAWTLIDKLKQTERALRFTQFAVDHSGTATFWCDAEGRFVYVNETACRLLGCERHELLCINIQQVFPAYRAEGWREFWARLKQAGTQSFESSVRRQNGSYVPVEVTANYLRYEGQEYNCALVQDISERKALEAQLAESRKMDAIGRLAGGFAHDFNNMLSVILSYSELLLNEFQTDDEPREMIQEIEKAAQRSAALTRQLLTGAAETHRNETPES